VTTIHAVAQGLEEQGFGSQLLAAVFKSAAASIRSTGSTATSEARSGLRPDGRGQKRDNAEELELKAKLEKEPRWSQTWRGGRRLRLAALASEPRLELQGSADPAFPAATAVLGGMAAICGCCVTVTLW